MLLQYDEDRCRIRTSAAHAGLGRDILLEPDDSTGESISAVRASFGIQLVVKTCIESVGCLVAEVLLGIYIRSALALYHDLRRTFAAYRYDKLITEINLLHYRVKPVVTVRKPSAYPQEKIDLSACRCFVSLDVFHD